MQKQTADSDHLTAISCRIGMIRRVHVFGYTALYLLALALLDPLSNQREYPSFL